MVKPPLLFFSLIGVAPGDHDPVGQGLPPRENFQIPLSSLKGLLKYVTSNGDAVALRIYLFLLSRRANSAKKPQIFQLTRVKTNKMFALPSFWHLVAIARTSASANFPSPGHVREIPGKTYDKYINQCYRAGIPDTYIENCITHRLLGKPGDLMELLLFSHAEGTQTTKHGIA